MASNKHDYPITCRFCKETHVVQADPRDVHRWQNGELIQRALPYLKAAERELMISKTCGKCFNEIFPPEEDEEEEAPCAFATQKGGKPMTDHVYQAYQPGSLTRQTHGAINIPKRPPLLNSVLNLAYFIINAIKANEPRENIERYLDMWRGDAKFNSVLQIHLKDLNPAEEKDVVAFLHLVGWSVRELIAITRWPEEAVKECLENQIWLQRYLLSTVRLDPVLKADMLELCSMLPLIQMPEGMRMKETLRSRRDRLCRAFNLSVEQMRQVSVLFVACDEEAYELIGCLREYRMATAAQEEERRIAAEKYQGGDKKTATIVIRDKPDADTEYDRRKQEEEQEMLKTSGFADFLSPYADGADEPLIDPMHAAELLHEFAEHFLFLAENAPQAALALQKDWRQYDFPFIFEVDVKDWSKVGLTPHQLDMVVYAAELVAQDGELNYEKWFELARCASREPLGNAHRLKARLMAAAGTPVEVIAAAINTSEQIAAAYTQNIDQAAGEYGLRYQRAVNILLTGVREKNKKYEQAKKKP